MPTDVIMPQMGESIFEGTLTKWLKKVGDTVTRDEPLFEISTDKVDAEIPAPSSGTLTEIKVQEGVTVQVNSVVGVIGEAGSAAASAPASASPSQSVPTVAPEKASSNNAETEIDTTRRDNPAVEAAAKPAEQKAVAQQQQNVTPVSGQQAQPQAPEGRTPPLLTPRPQDR